MTQPDVVAEVTEGDIMPEVHGIRRSQSMNRLVMEHEWKVQEEHNANHWNSFCLVMDRRAVQYFCQVFIIAGTMLFAAYQLKTLHDCDAQQAYLGLLTLLIGLVLPNPKFHNDQHSQN